MPPKRGTANIMLMVWLLWIVVVIGGFYMGIGSALGSYNKGFDIPLALNALIYLGCAIYGLPKFLKFLFGKQSS